MLIVTLPAVSPSPVSGQTAPSAVADVAQACADLATRTYYEHSVPSTGTVRASMIFVDFPDADGVTPTEDVFAQLAEAEGWFAENSYDQFELTIAPVHGWREMSQPSTEYPLRRDEPSTWEEFRDYMQEAADLVDDEHDFSDSRIIYVVTPDGAAQDYSPAVTHNPGDLVLADGADIHAGSPLGGNIYANEGELGPKVLAHETGHLLGEPDYYDLSADSHQATHRFVGPWDLMGSMFENRHFSAWTKFRLGWLDSSRLECLDNPTQQAFTLSPTTRGEGLTALVVPTSESEGYVLEARHPERADGSICTGGLLVSAVDERRANEDGPLRVQPQEADDPDRLADCGQLHNAPFEAGERFDAAGIAATVSEVADDGAVTVEVTADGLDDGDDGDDGNDGNDGDDGSSEPLQRIAGADRFATAGQLAPHVDGDTLWVATGFDFADALAAGATAAGPVLLVAGDAAPPRTLEAAAGLDGIARVRAVGGPGALGDEAVAAVADAANVADVDRLAGAHRFATAAEVSADAHPQGAEVAYVATGLAFPDALTASVAAADDGAPVLLTAHDVLPGATRDELARLGVNRVVVVGGEAAVGPGVEAELAELVADVERISGRDRWATAAAVSVHRGLSPQAAFLATGEDFPDVLAAAPAAITAGGALLVTGRDLLPEAIRTELERLAVERATIVGGESAVSPAVSDEVRLLLTGESSPTQQ